MIWKFTSDSGKCSLMFEESMEGVSSTYNYVLEGSIIPISELPTKVDATELTKFSKTRCERPALEEITWYENQKGV